jgi:hypothetical protein
MNEERKPKNSVAGITLVSKRQLLETVPGLTRGGIDWDLFNRCFT